MSLTDHMNPGDYCVALTTAADVTAFQARRAGLEVRDCFSVQTPTGVLVGVLLRAPLEDTVVGQVVRNGTGAVDIDAARISTTDSLDGGMTTRGKRSALYGDRPYMHDEDKLAANRQASKRNVAKAENLGRFPSNFLLVHGPDCERVGTRKVKSGVAGPNSHGLGDRVYGSMKEYKPDERAITYASEDGTEEVPDWHCQPNCPVRLLDLQSGDLAPQGAPKRKDTGNNSLFGGGNPDGPFYGDGGGASRFFEQGTSLDEIKAYVVRLCGNPYIYEDS